METTMINEKKYTGSTIAEAAFKIKDAPEHHKPVLRALKKANQGKHFLFPMDFCYIFTKTV